MVGSAIVRRLRTIEGVTTLTATRSELDLRDAAATEKWVIDQRPDLVFMAAAKVGGIVANNDRPVDFLEQNLQIELSTISAAFKGKVEKFLLLGSSCVYPKFAPQPILESSLLTSSLEPTNQWYAVAKIAGVMLCDAYRKQHGANFISAMPSNLYGPNDNYDLQSGHVMAAALRKIAQAKKAGSPSVTIWGSGEPLREFLHVDDLADALVFLMQNFSDFGPINVGTGQEISIGDLYKLIAEIVGYSGKFELDRSKPDGTPRKVVDTSRLAEMGWQPRIALAAGISAVARDIITFPPHVRSQ